MKKYLLSFFALIGLAVMIMAATDKGVFDQRLMQAIFTKLPDGDLSFNTNSLFIKKSDGKIGIGTTAPASDLALGGAASRTIQMDRHPTANTAGNSLTVKAGGATSGATDKLGGDLYLSSGIATGNSGSDIHLQTPTQGTTGTTDRTPSTKMSILANGRVGIGTTVPAALLDVNGGARIYGIASFDGATYAGTAFRAAGVHKGYIASANAVISGGSVDDLVVDSSAGKLILATGDTRRVTIDGTGVGIGSATPAVALDVVGSTKVSSILNVGSSTSASSIRLGQSISVDNTENYGGAALNTWASSPGYAAFLDFNRSKGATVGTHTAVATDDYLGYLLFRGSDGVSAFKNGAIISAQVGTGTVSATSMPGKLSFKTAPDGSVNPAERMTILADGNVGIGTSTPTALFTVKGGTVNASSLATSYSNAQISLQLKSSSGYYTTLGAGPSDVPYLQVSAGGGSSAGDFLINPYGGKVGIGTGAPTSLLHLYSTDSFITRMQAATADRYVLQSMTNGTARLYTGVDGTTPGSICGGTLAYSGVICTDVAYPLHLGTNGTTKMTILSDGNVGIGTTAPSGLLTLYSPDDSVSPALTIRQNNNNGASGWDFNLDTLIDGKLYLSRYATGRTDVVTFDSTGKVGIGTTAPGALLHVYSSTSGNLAYIQGNSMSHGEFTYYSAYGIHNSGGRYAHLGVSTNASLTYAAGYLGLDADNGIRTYLWSLSGGSLYFSTDSANIGTSTGNQISYTSDERLKQNKSPIGYGLKEIMKLQPIQFDLDGRHSIGFGAQTVREVLPETVYDSGETFVVDGKTYDHKLNMNYEKVVPVLVRAMQEQQAIIELQKKWICEQENAPSELCVIN